MEEEMTNSISGLEDVSSVAQIAHSG